MVVLGENQDLFPEPVTAVAGNNSESIKKFRALPQIFWNTPSGRARRVSRSGRCPSAVRLVQARTAIPARYSPENFGFATARPVRRAMSDSMARLSLPVSFPQSKVRESKVLPA